MGQEERRAVRPLVVGLDGRSGVGKSTMAAAVAGGVAGVTHSWAATVIDGDDFYTGGAPETWDGRSAADSAREAIDWRRQRGVLGLLRDRRPASWSPFDWSADSWDSDAMPLVRVPETARPTAVVVLEGVYSCRPELHDLLDLRVLVEAPSALRRERLRDREGEDHDAGWERRWSDAEEHYFGLVMTPDRFDLVIGPSTAHDALAQAIGRALERRDDDVSRRDRRT